MDYVVIPLYIPVDDQGRPRSTSRKKFNVESGFFYVRKKVFQDHNTNLFEIHHIPREILVIKYQRSSNTSLYRRKRMANLKKIAMELSSDDIAKLVTLRKGEVKKLEEQRKRLKSKLAEVEKKIAQLNGKKRYMSAKTRARISKASKKYWADQRAQREKKSKAMKKVWQRRKEKTKKSA